MINKDMKGCTTSLVSEIHIKTMRYHYTPTRTVKIKNLTRCLSRLSGEDAEQLKHSYIAGKNVKWYTHFGKQLRQFKVQLVLTV